MFPLNWNIPFIRKNGSRTTLGAITGDIAGIEEDIMELTDKTDGLWDNMIENGAVNLLPNKGTTQTINDVAFTVNSDRTITANGANTSTSAIAYEIDAVSDNYVLPAGSYKLTGCPSNGGNNTWRLQAYKTDGTTIVAIDSGSGETFTLTEPTQLVVKIRIGGSAGSGTLTNLTFKPMISAQPLNLSYDDYVPYAMTNRKLTDREIITRKITGNSSVTVTGGQSVAYTDFTLPTDYELVGIVGYNLVAPIIPINVGNQGDNDIVARLDLYNLLETDKTFIPQINVLLRKTT